MLRVAIEPLWQRSAWSCSQRVGSGRQRVFCSGTVKIHLRRTLVTVCLSVCGQFVRVSSLSLSSPCKMERINESLASWSGVCNSLSYAHHLIFSFAFLKILFIPCGRLSWLPVSFLLHVKYTLSYRIVSYVFTSWSALCPSVFSFNSTKHRAQYFIVSYIGYRFIAACN